MVLQTVEYGVERYLTFSMFKSRPIVHSHHEVVVTKPVVTQTTNHYQMKGWTISFQLWSSWDVVRNASRALKIGVHLPFDPHFDVGIGTFYPEKFRQA